MDLSFPRPSPIAAPIDPPPDAAAALSALSAYRCALQAGARDLLMPADGAFNIGVARLLCAAAAADRTIAGRPPIARQY